MAARSIIQVDIDPEGKFKAFYDTFQKYQKQLESMPEDWKKVVDALGDTNDEMSDFAKASGASKDFLMISAIQADAISKSMARATGVQDKFNVKAKDGAIQMGRMAKASQVMEKTILNMGRVLLKLGTVSIGAIGGAAGAVYGATSEIAGQNLQARGLGLRIGMTQAFGANFERFGLGTSDLGNVANAQSDVSKWRAFMAAGLTPQQIQSEDAEQLTYDFARAASSKYRQWQKSGMPAGTMAQAYGFTDFLSLQQLRTGASYDDAKWAAAQSKTLTDAKSNEISQGLADQASDVKAALQSDWAKVLNEFNSQLATAAPELKLMGDAASAAAINLLKVAGPAAKSLLDEIENPKPLPQGGLHPTLMHPNSLGQGFHAIGDSLRALSFGTISRNAATSLTGSPTISGMLGAQYYVESGSGAHLLSRRGAMGPFQFMPDTWKEWGNGGDVNNFNDSRAAAQRYDDFLLKRYGGDVRKALAAYNWGMGNVDKTVAYANQHHTNWEAGLPRETQGYLNQISRLMANLGQSVNINITNSTPSRVAVSMNAAAH